jgi:hypothetical protein
VLARLERIDGVARAEVDYGGNYMRLTISGPSAQREATALLNESGYRPEIADRDSAPNKWYDLSSVHELLAVEADVIARRVVARFDRTSPLGDDASRLEPAIAAALQRTFEVNRGRTDVAPGAFRREAVESVRSAAAAILDPAKADAFAEMLTADLNEDHTRAAGL